jgi:hypothetical protein
MLHFLIWTVLGFVPAAVLVTIKQKNTSKYWYIPTLIISMFFGPFYGLVCLWSFITGKTLFTSNPKSFF